MTVAKQELEHDCCKPKMVFLVLLSLVAVGVEGKGEELKEERNKNKEGIGNNTAK